MLEFNSGEGWWPVTCSRCSVQNTHLPLVVQPKPSTKGRSAMCTCKMSRRQKKNSSSLGNWASLQANWGKGSTGRQLGMSANWGLVTTGSMGWFFKGPRKWDSEKQMEVVIVAPTYYIRKCDCYFSVCLWDNVQESACHWGLKAPIWM